MTGLFLCASLCAKYKPGKLTNEHIFIKIFTGVGTRVGHHLDCTAVRNISQMPALWV